MRVAVSGASGTGKSTLAEWISKTYGIPINPVGSRSVSQAMGFVTPYDVDKAGKRAEFQKRLVTEKVEWEAKHESFVTDRTTFDNLAYTALHDVHSVDDALMSAAIDGMQRYTNIFLCPVSGFWDPGTDPARVKARVYHELFEALTFGLIRQRFQLWTYALKCTKVSARQIEVGNILGKPTT
jgi:predicted ATPase